MAASAHAMTQEKTLLSWKALSRPFKPRSREAYVTIVSIASLLGLVLFLIEGVMPVFLIIALLFLYYVMTTVKPDEMEYRITTFGIRVADTLFSWDSMTRFWFSERFGSEILVVETLNLPGRFELVMKKNMRKKIEREMKKHLPLEEASPTAYDRATQAISKRLPFE